MKKILLIGMLSLTFLLVVTPVSAGWWSDFWGWVFGSEDPEDTREIGYELLNNNQVLHIWNTKNNYYFNVTSGIQFTNWYEEYWTKNVFCAGYKTDEWHYTCNDAVNFNWNIEADNLTFINITGYKDLIFSGKEVRVILRYHLKLNDKELSVIPAIKNIGTSDINVDLGFAWRVKDIRINNNIENDKLFINNSVYYLNETLDLRFTDMTKLVKHYNYSYYYNGDYKETIKTNDYNYTVKIPFYKIKDRASVDLRWNENLSYFVDVKSASHLYNAPITLGINAGPLLQGQTKKTPIYWSDATGKTPMIYYRFEGNTSDEGDGGLGYTLTEVNSPVYNVTSGKIDIAIDFEEDTPSYASKTDCTGSEITKIRTIDFWFKPEDISSGDAPFSISDGTISNTLYITYGGDGKIDLALRIGNVQKFFLASDTVFLQGVWYHIIIVTGTSGAELFINGTSEDTDASTDVIGSWSNIHIGFAVPDFTGDGMIDNFALFDEEYDTDDVTWSWNSGAGRNFLIIPNTAPEKAEVLAPTNKQTLGYVDINYTANDVDADTLTFYTYINGTLNGTSTGNLTNWINLHNISDDHYGVRVRAHDGTDYGAYSDMVNFTVDTTPSMTITLNAPDDNEIDNTLTNNFLFTPVSEQYDFLNCTLYHNETVTFAWEVINTTVIVNDSSNTLTDTFAAEGIYLWNVECCDDNYNCNFSAANRTLEIDTTAPILSNSLLNVTPAINEQFAMNITVEEANPDSSRSAWNITGTMINNSIQGYTLNPQNLSTAKQNTKARGDYICWKYWANDTAGNEAWSSESCFTVVNAIPSNAVILEPEHGDHLIDVDINYTAHDADGDTLTFHVYINDTFNSSSTSNLTNWGTDVANGHYGVVVSAYDGWNFSVNSSMINFTFDTTDPTLTIGSNLRSNQTMVYAPENITGSINCSDTTLFSLKVAVDEALFFSALNITSNSYNYNLSYNATEKGLSEGVHQIEINCSDGHTIRKIPAWNYVKSSLDKSIKYKFDDGWIKIKPINKGLFSSFDTKKLNDRYTFEFKRDWTAKILYGNDIEFEVSSSDPLIIVSKKEYEGWLVSDHLNKWIDFESFYRDVSLERISDKKIRVYIADVGEDFVIFNSIGELNTVSGSYSFYFGNSTAETGGEQRTETAISIFTLGLTKNSSQVSDIDASLIWNNTLYAPTKTTSTDSINFSGTVIIPLINGDQENMEYYWNYTLTGIVNNQSGNTSRTNQVVYKMIITNCSLNNLTTLSFSVYNKTDDLVAVDTEALFTVWNDSSANKRNWNLSYLNSSTPKFCIAPTFAILNSDYRIEYTPLNTALYGENLYAKDGQILTNTSQSINLYVQNKTGKTEITITVVDEYDEGKYGVIVMAYEYDISINNFTLITTEETDLDGIVKMDLDTSEKHKFIVEENGVNVYESPTMKLFQTSYTFRIGAIGEESVVLDLENLESGITWTEDTREIILTWNDISGLITQIYLEVYKTNVSNVTLLSQQISGSSSGTITYTLANESGVYLGNVYVDASADGNKYFIDFVTISEMEAYDIFGTETLVASFFFIAVIVILGFMISAEVGLVISIISMAGFFFMGFIQMAPAGVIGIIISFVIFLVRIQRR